MFNDNSNVHEAIVIDPVTLANASVAIKLDHAPAISRPVTIRFSVNNITNEHNIIGVTFAKKTSNVPSGADQVTLVAGRSASVTLTYDFMKR
jgi:outer membrane receptor protein involved in Fe transport